MNATYDFSDVQKVIDKLGEKDKVILKHSHKLANDSEKLLQQKLRSQSKSGKLYNSVPGATEVNIQKRGFKKNVIIKIGSNLDYSYIAAETGRKPGKMPPSKELERWVGQAFGVTGKAKKSTAFLVARKIGKKGTKKYRSGGPKLVTQAVNSIKSAAVPRFLRNLGELANV